MGSRRAWECQRGRKLIKIVTENFPNLENDRNIHIQKSRRLPENFKQIYPKTSHNQTLKDEQQKRNNTQGYYSSPHSRPLSRKLTGQERVAWDFHSTEEKTYQSKILLPWKERYDLGIKEGKDTPNNSWQTISPPDLFYKKC